MPRKRNAENQGLPSRWQKSHGAYYYQVPESSRKHWAGKKKFRLGATLPEAYAVWTDRVGAVAGGKNISQLLERYEAECIPKKAVATQHRELRGIANLRAVFGHMRLDELKPKHVYAYVDKRKMKKLNESGKPVGGRASAIREKSILSHAFTMAVQWGYIDRHPFLHEVKFEGSEPRTRYVEDWEIEECLKIKSRQAVGSVRAIQAYILLKWLTGLRKADLLQLKLSDCHEDGLYVTPKKTKRSTGKALIFEWSPALREAIRLAQVARPNQRSEWLFCNRKGSIYYKEDTGRADGWNSMWQRFMRRVLKETKVTESFTDHDIRAKSGSDAASLDDAQRMLAHSSSAVTKRHYRRKPERVKPLR
jgi:integrase